MPPGSGSQQTLASLGRDLDQASAEARAGLRASTEQLARELAEPSPGKGAARVRRLRCSPVRVLSLLAGLVMAALPPLHPAARPGLRPSGASRRLFWKVFNFVLFFGVLGWLLRKPLGQFFRGRREAIAHQLAEATRQREEAERLQREMETRIAGLETEISTLRERLRLEGERERQALEQQGEAESARLLAQLDQEASRRVAAARTLLAHEAAETAVALARELLARELDPADRDRIFRATLERLQQTGGQA